MRHLATNNVAIFATNIVDYCRITKKCYTMSQKMRRFNVKNDWLLWFVSVFRIDRKQRLYYRTGITKIISLACTYAFYPIFKWCDHWRNYNNNISCLYKTRNIGYCTKAKHWCGVLVLFHVFFLFYAQKRYLLHQMFIWTYWQGDIASAWSVMLVFAVH